MDIQDLNRTEKAIEKDKETLSAYQWFKTEQGQKVLLDMLYELYFLQETTTPEQQALNNYAKSLLGIVYGTNLPQASLIRLLQKLFKKWRT
jgi:hypothetical protein